MAEVRLISVYLIVPPSCSCFRADVLIVTKRRNFQLVGRAICTITQIADVKTIVSFGSRIFAWNLMQSWLSVFDQLQSCHKMVSKSFEYIFDNFQPLS